MLGGTVVASRLQVHISSTQWTEDKRKEENPIQYFITWLATLKIFHQFPHTLIFLSFGHCFIFMTKEIKDLPAF